MTELFYKTDCARQYESKHSPGLTTLFVGKTDTLETSKCFLTTIFPSHCFSTNHSPSHISQPQVADSVLLRMRTYPFLLLLTQYAGAGKPVSSCQKAFMNTRQRLFRVPEKPFPSQKTPFYTDARHTICRYTSDCFNVSESARTQADGMLSANTRFSETLRCPHSPISSTVLRLLSVCQRHIRSISFHPSSFESPYPVLHLSR